jgi:hemerythrin
MSSHPNHMAHDKNKHADVSWMPQLQPIAWSDSLATGIKVIDDQHKMLVNIINDIYQGLTGKYNRISLQRIILELRGYIDYHFGAEEQLMSEHDFSFEHPNEHELHLRQHQDFIDRLAELEQQLERNRPVFYEDLFIYLRDWLANHILHTDRKLADFLKSCPPQPDPSLD